MSRGHNKENIFLCTQDYKVFINKLKKYSQKFKVDIIAYTIMPNHIHILIHDSNETKSDFMKMINQTYAAYFNKKYGRIGAVFQDRYKCKGIENTKYLQTAFLYVITNPSQAKICQTFDYKWNCYNDIISKNTTIKHDYWKSLFGDISNLKKQILNYETKKFIEETDPIVDYLAQEYLLKELNIKDPHQILLAPKSIKKDVAKNLYNLNISIKKLKKLTGLSLSTLYRTIK